MTVSRERNDIADHYTDCTSANKRRDFSKQDKNSKEGRFNSQDSEVRLYNDFTNGKTQLTIILDNYKLSQKLFVNNCEDAKFKAKGIPRSHKVPHMIFHSTKGLTQPHEFKFNINKKDKIQEAEGEGEIRDDEETQVSKQH